ncbi:MAG: Abi family protein [Fibromonadaceae bacterium]|jgi:abortive infection bacteriophage resistance protein|nr:Abi family protein [Fibromonadaceae bacterium]
MKTAKTIAELIELLESRSLIFADERKAENFLLQNNYYRLSGYWRRYQTCPDKGDNGFADGTSFEKVVGIYRLDASLRNYLQNGLGVFEICFRSKFAYYMAHSEANGQFLYLHQSSYGNKVSKNEKPDDLLTSIKKELNRSKEKCVIHYKRKNEDIPIWAAVEVLSFGTVSKMYSRWTNKEVIKKVSQSFSLFKSYESTIHIIRSLVNLRNLCAHQARIWNRELIFQVASKTYLQKFGVSKERSQWRIISILMLLVDGINQNNEYSRDILKLCRQEEEFYAGLTSPTL